MRFIHIALVIVLVAPALVARERTVAEAAAAGDVALARALLKNGADVNEAQGDGMTALHWAAQRGDAEMVDLLLAAGANVKAMSRLGGYTALHLAAQGGHARVVAALVTAGGDVNQPTTTGATAVMLAAKSGSADTVTRLLEVGADPNAKEQAFGQTPLMVAAAFDRADVVSLLLKRGADPSTASAVADLKALTAPAESDRASMGGPTGGPTAVPGLTRPYTYNELIGYQGGLTALHFAARQGSAAAVRALVEGGAAVDAPSPGDKATPLLVAIINGHFDIAAYLLDHGADASLASDAGVTPLYAVVNLQWAPIAAYPQPRAQLQQATSYLDLMQKLIDKGADPNARVARKVWYSGYNFDQSSVDEIGATPFWRAAYASDIAAMKLLVAAGADPAIPTMKPASRRGPEDMGGGGPDTATTPPLPVGGPSVTPLQAAAGVGYGFGFAGNSHHFAPTGMMAAVKYLVEELGADVNAVDADGNTALHHAAARGDNEMILYLVSKGADVTKVNRRGQTTVDMANGPVQRVEPFPDTIALLEKLGAKNNHHCVSC